ncbi:MAG: hypothetical protein FWH29_11115, partial [Methanobrevibacter sp.]|nr:hypothetical protein [Methanobrevibacter sp.]
LNTKANYSNSILEIENIKFIYKYNKYLDLHLVSYIEKELDIEKKYLLNSTYLSFFYIIIILIILILICYKWFANKLKDISRVGESIDYTKVSYLDDINKYYLNIYNNLINNDIKDKIIENILKIQSNTFELKKIIENSNNKIMKLKDLTSSYKNLEMNGNMLEINMSILCNQLEDNRLNDVLLMIKKTNQKLRDVNLDNVEVSTIKLEYNKLFSLFEKINNSIELLNSVEKNRINLLNNLKIKLDSKSNEIKRYN